MIRSPPSQSHQAECKKQYPSQFLCLPQNLCAPLASPRALSFLYILLSFSAFRHYFCGFWACHSEVNTTGYGYCNEGEPHLGIGGLSELFILFAFSFSGVFDRLLDLLGFPRLDPCGMGGDLRDLIRGDGGALPFDLKCRLYLN